MDKGTLTGRFHREPPRPHRILTPRAIELRAALRGEPKELAFGIDYTTLELRIWTQGKDRFDQNCP